MEASAIGSGDVRAVAPRITEDADYWRRRADEALEVAYELRDGPSITRMLEIGRRYERFARQAEQRERETH
jgi:hypothetical protein